MKRSRLTAKTTRKLENVDSKHARLSDNRSRMGATIGVVKLESPRPEPMQKIECKVSRHVLCLHAYRFSINPYRKFATKQTLSARRDVIILNGVRQFQSLFITMKLLNISTRQFQLSAFMG